MALKKIIIKIIEIETHLLLWSYWSDVRTKAADGFWKTNTNDNKKKSLNI